MIKFFRQIRQRLLAENKFSKYLLYAIGEILLVVIGILIALNINNKNELQKNELTVISALKEIQKNLLQDIEESQNNVEDYLESDSIFNKTFDFENPWTTEDYKNGAFQQLGHLYYDYQVNKNGYENLLRHIDKLPPAYENILGDFKILYVDLYENIQVANKRLQNTVYSQNDFIFNKNWYVHRRKYDEISSDEIDYHINDDNYKRYLLKFVNDRRQVLKHGQRYSIKAIESYMKIDSLLNEKNNALPRQALGKVQSESDINKYLGEYTFLNFNEIPYSFKFFFEQDYLYSYDDLNGTLKHYRINDELYMYIMPEVNYPSIWKFVQNENGKIVVDFINLPLPDMLKKD